MTRKHIVDHVKLLLQKVFELGIRVKLVLLDAGYFSVEVINYLKALGLQFIIIIRMPNKGKFKDGDDPMYRVNTHRPHMNERSTFRAVAFNGKNRVGKIDRSSFSYLLQIWM